MTPFSHMEKPPTASRADKDFPLTPVHSAVSQSRHGLPLSRWVVRPFSEIQSDKNWLKNWPLSRLRSMISPCPFSIENRNEARLPWTFLRHDELKLYEKQWWHKRSYKGMELFPEAFMSLSMMHELGRGLVMSCAQVFGVLHHPPPQSSTGESSVQFIGVFS